MVDRKESILDLAIEMNSKNTNFQTSELQFGESILLIIGSKGAGKSSLINLLQDKDEVPKSTLALDYNFVRRSGKSLLKDVCHIWELGGGTMFSELIEIPMRASGNLKRITVVIMLDLSLPHQLWLTLDHFITKLLNFLTQYAAEKKLSDELQSKAWKKMGDMEHHQDKSSIQPFLVPLVIIGGKYDIYQQFDSEDKNLVCQTLRSVAHGYGSILVYYSLKDQVLAKCTKDLLNQLAFTSSYSTKHISQDHLRPLFIPPGADSFQQIWGTPISGGLSVAMQKWKHTFSSQFPQKEGETKIIPEDPAKDKNFEEPVIDALRSRKNDEFDKYQWEMDKNLWLKTV